MIFIFGAGALEWPRGMAWGGRREGGSGWGTHVHPWRIHVNVWQKPIQYCKVISLQKRKKMVLSFSRQDGVTGTGFILVFQTTTGQTARQWFSRCKTSGNKGQQSPRERKQRRWALKVSQTSVQDGEIQSGGSGVELGAPGSPGR